MLLNTRAGFPATIEFAGTFRVTTLPAPTMAFSPIVRLARIVAPEPIEAPRSISENAIDRKSTRLNSSHQIISYAVFCLKKKKKKKYCDIDVLQTVTNIE